MSEDNILSNIKSIQENYLTLNKDFQQLQSMENKSNETLSYSMGTYTKIKNSLSKNFVLLDQLITKIEESQYKESHEKEIKQIFQKVNRKKLGEKFEEFKKITNTIDSKMQNFIPLYSQEEEKKEKNEGPIKGILQITEYSNALKEREEALKQAKIISGQIVDLTNDMKYEIIKQEEKFNEIDDNMLKVDENVEKGLKDLKQIDVINKANKKRLYCLICLIIFVLGVIFYFVFKFFRS